MFSPQKFDLQFKSGQVKLGQVKAGNSKTRNFYWLKRFLDIKFVDSEMKIFVPQIFVDPKF